MRNFAILDPRGHVRASGSGFRLGLGWEPCLENMFLWRKCVDPWSESLDPLLGRLYLNLRPSAGPPRQSSAPKSREPSQNVKPNPLLSPRPRKASHPLLRADQELHLSFGIDLNVKSALTPGSNGLTKWRRTGVETVRGSIWTMDRLGHRLQHLGRRWQI